MGRRKTIQTNRFEDGSRSSVGDHYVDTACKALDTACAKEAALFVPHLSADEVTPMVFKDDVIAKLKAVHGLLSYEDKDATYDLRPHARGHLMVKTLFRPAASPGGFQWHQDRAGPLKAAVDAIVELHIKWGAVKHLLRWFNRNATPGAVRANWPSVLALCPDAPNLKELQHAPLRYTNPQELSTLLPIIRATASTVASMKLLPGDVSPRLREGVSLVLPALTVTYEGVDVILESQTFNL